MPFNVAKPGGKSKGRPLVRHITLSGQCLFFRMAFVPNSHY